jgi:equilibrative nucleoside transporter 1/2/3
MFRVEYLITFGLCGVSIGVFLLTFVAELMPTLGGYIVCLLICFCLGAFTTIAQYAAIGLVSQTCLKLISLYWGGTAWSGLTMNALLALSYAVFPPPSTTSADVNEKNLLYANLMFNVCAMLLCGGCIGATFIFVKASYYKVELYPKYCEQQKKQDKLNYGKQIKDGIKLAPWIPILMFLNYIQTFLMFPGVSVF